MNLLPVILINSLTATNNVITMCSIINAQAKFSERNALCGNTGIVDNKVINEADCNLLREGGCKNSYYSRNGTGRGYRFIIGASNKEVE